MIVRRFLVFLCFMACANAQALTVSQGQLITYWQMPSQWVAARNVHVWLPEHYDMTKGGKDQFAVLYMHDGQMLFDKTSTWNGQEWGVDEVASQLMATGKTRNFIIVGIDNGGSERRHAEYFPQKPFESLPTDYQNQLYGVSRGAGESLFSGNKVQSDGYLSFLVKELKPFIEANFRVATGPENTFVMGSSMGGLISMYAISEYPDVFGGAACLSTHWPGIFSMDDNPIPNAFMDYMTGHLPDPATHRLYFDYGDQTLDAMYPPLQKQADAVIEKKGYGPSSWETRFFPGANHSEEAWQARLDQPLLFLLSRP